MQQTLITNEDHKLCLKTAKMQKEDSEVKFILTTLQGPLRILKPNTL